MRKDKKPMLRHIYVDGEPANKQTIVICAVVVPIAAILITLGLLAVLFRDRLRRSYRRWRCERHSARDEAWTHAVGQNGILVGSNDIALQLQMYAVQINDANDSSDHVALVMPGLLSVMDAPTSSSRGVHGYPRRHSTSASVFDDDGSSADGSEAGSEHTPEMPGVTIAFGTGASTSFAHSAATTSAAGYLMHHSAQSAAGVGSRVRNPLAMQIPDRSRSVAGGGADASRPRSVVFPAQYADSDGDNNVESAAEGSQSRAVLGEVIVPNVSFSMGYHGAQEEGDSTVDGVHNRSAGRPPHDTRLRPRRDSSGPRRRSRMWGSRGSARRRRPSQHLVSGTPNLDRHVQRLLAHAGPSRSSPGDVGEGAGVEGPHTMHRSGSTSYGLWNDDEKYVEDDHDSYGSGFEYLCRDDGVLIERDGPPPSSSSSASRLVETNDTRDSHEMGTLIFM